LKNKTILLDNIDAIIFDFDGVLTNNLVIVNQDGSESVVCNRLDGLAFDALRKLQKPAYILSTEKNKVVTVRAEKLKVKVFQGVDNKSDIAKKLVDREGFNLEKILYVGNDLNDYHVMKLCGYTVCPADSHVNIQKISDVVLKTRGGEGVVREILEDILELDLVQILFQ
jgi:YrbI family 3-deoxy-D-manno-octulosonate 8-phosphate phosphatase